MEGENNSVSTNESINSSGGENKSNSILWSIIAIVIVVVLGYLLLRSNPREDNINGNTENINQAQEPVDNIGTQSDSSDINSIEADLETTNFNSLEVEME